MKKARLQKLVQHLYKVGADIASGKLVDKFDMSTWGELEEQGKFKARKDMSCMTAACAIGHAGSIFKSEGFFLEMDELEVDEEGNTYGGEYVVPSYKGLHEIDAVAKFFDITVEDAEYLFMPDQYSRHNSMGERDIDYVTGPGEVADRIRKFMEK